ncbi:hypothetical protein [Pedobacter sp. UBA5917]|jgi:hypothetical protein|uniref:hypothetical protein n=1 Tax=Pedobacter sp. UBA5917 TaxID=1947061 RepID=UPI0025DAFD0C|nr:hypothetical protein [Pedobacter sp. UBA5917]
MHINRSELILLAISAILLLSCKPKESTGNGKSTNYIKNNTKQAVTFQAERSVIVAGNKIDLPDGSGNNLFNGIFEFGKDSFSNYSNVLKKDLLYFTTNEDVGFGNRSYLYVYNTLSKVLVYDPQFKREYLYSSFGKFYIDKKLIFCVIKPAWDKKYHSFRLSVAVYQVLNKRFHFLKLFSEPEEKIITNLDIEFYKKGISKAQ